MTRFIALAWNHRLDQAAADVERAKERLAGARPDWVLRFECPGLLIYQPPVSGAGVLLKDNVGFIAGLVFERGSHRPVANEQLDGAAWIKRAAQPVFSEIWGRYVAFINDRDGACVYIARDPSGMMSCFMARIGKVQAFFADSFDVEAIALKNWDINYTYLARRLADNRDIGRETGFTEVTELAPGAVACFGQGRSRIDQAWDIGDAAHRGITQDPRAASEALTEAVTLACKAFSGLYPRCGVRLSGGLDSAIVTGILSRARCTELLAVNFATPNAEGDERAYAAAVADAAGIPLQVFILDPAGVDLAGVVRHPLSARPMLWLAGGETEALERDFAASRAIDAYFGGRGGDNVFLRTHHAGTLIDYVADHGVDLELVQRVWRQARAVRKPFGELLGEVLASRVRRPKDRLPQPELRILSNDARELLGPPPSLDTSLPFGKRLHAWLIEDRLAYVEPTRAVDYVYPLVAQPVLETVMGIASHVLSSAGADRGLARRAFADVVPATILHRTSKSKTTAYLGEVLARNLSFLRAYLLDGETSAAGLINRGALASTLTEQALMRDLRVLPSITAALSVEAWLRSARNAASSRSLAA